MTDSRRNIMSVQSLNFKKTETDPNAAWFLAGSYCVLACCGPKSPVCYSSSQLNYRLILQLPMVLSKPSDRKRHFLNVFCLISFQSLYIESVFLFSNTRYLFNQLVLFSFYPDSRKISGHPVWLNSQLQVYPSKPQHIYSYFNTFITLNNWYEIA